MTNRHFAFALGGALAAMLAGCSAQQAANLQAAASISCNAAEIAAAASVTISADVNASQQAQKDAATAQKVTSDTCAALTKLPSVVAPVPAPAASSS
jgi:uncharacterized protein YcfL